MKINSSNTVTKKINNNPNKTSRKHINKSNSHQRNPNAYSRKPNRPNISLKTTPITNTKKKIKNSMINTDRTNLLIIPINIGKVHPDLITRIINSLLTIQTTGIQSFGRENTFMNPPINKSKKVHITDQLKAPNRTLEEEEIYCLKKRKLKEPRRKATMQKIKIDMLRKGRIGILKKTKTGDKYLTLILNKIKIKTPTRTPSPILTVILRTLISRIQRTTRI